MIALARCLITTAAKGVGAAAEPFLPDWPFPEHAIPTRDLLIKMERERYRVDELPQAEVLRAARQIACHVAHLEPEVGWSSTRDRCMAIALAAVEIVRRIRDHAGLDAAVSAAQAAMAVIASVPDHAGPDAVVAGSQRALQARFASRVRHIVDGVNRKQHQRQADRRARHETEARGPRILDRGSYQVVKQGHIVAATYQRDFATDGLVAVHVPGRTDCVTLKVENAGTRSRAYRRTRPDGSEVDDVEASVAEMETLAGPALAEVATGDPITDEAKGRLSQFIAAQMVRGPMFFALTEKTAVEQVQQAMTKETAPPARWRPPVGTSNWSAIARSPSCGASGSTT